MSRCLSPMCCARFSPAITTQNRGRDTFYRQMAYVGSLLVEHGVPVIFDATANRRAYRERARRQIGRFIEVYVDVPLETCMARDPKGIYRSAAAGRGHATYRDCRTLTSRRRHRRS